MASLARPAAPAGLHYPVEAVERAPDLDHDLAARGRQADAENAALEDGYADLILQPGQPPADRRRLDSKQLRSTRKIAGFDRG